VFITSFTMGWSKRFKIAAPENSALIFRFDFTICGVCEESPQVRILGRHDKPRATVQGVKLKFFVALEAAIRQFDKEGSQPRRATLEIARRAFENAGVVFIDENGSGPGVRLRKNRG
jgi:hypothetical protein